MELLQVPDPPVKYKIEKMVHTKDSERQKIRKKKRKQEVLHMKILDYTALAVVIIGAINWGLIGFFQFDLVRVLFGDMSLLSRIVYALVGICGLYTITFFGRIAGND